MQIAIEGRIQSANPSSRGQQRVSRILAAASELFLEEGYSSTPVDRIVEKSGGSKATLYSYFPTKADLFRAVVEHIVPVAACPTMLGVSAGIRGALQEFAEQQLATELSPRHVALYRLVVAEKERFPDLAQMYYERGPLMGYHSLVAYLASLREARKLATDDVAEAAQFFLGMLLHQWSREILLSRAQPHSKREIAERVARVVDRFMLCYCSD